MKISLAGFSLLVFLALLVWASLFFDAPPAPVTASAPATEFSAERAMGYVRLFAQNPHPVGTEEHARVRDALVNELSKTGLTPEVQTALVSRLGFLTARVENVLARLQGTSSGPALALVTHYDSVPAAPGAGDDASGCAMLLETLRALRAGPPLRNDVLFVFTDGEEDGLLGASAFVAEHPWAKDIGLVLNFDSRGNQGPVWLYETSDQNGWLLREFAHAAPHPMGSSLMFEIYRRMPNDSDFSVFRRRGFSGLNFAFIGGWSAYHTARDAPDALSLASLQHGGSYALALARHFGSLDLSNPRGPNAVYFNLPAMGFFEYPASWSAPLAVAAAILFVLIAAVQLWRRRTSLYGLLFGAMGMVVAAALPVVAASFLLRAINFAHGRWLPEGDIVRSAMYAWSLVALGLAVTAAVYALLRLRFSAQSLALGALLGWVGIALCAAWFIPGVSFLPLWPLVCALIATAAVSSGGEEDAVHRWAYLLLFPLAVPLVFLFAPLVQGFFLGLGLTSGGTLAVAAAFAAALTLLVSQIEMITRRGRALLPVLALLAGVVLLATGARVTRYDAAHPKPSNAVYAWNADTGEALWAAAAARPDAWTSQLLSASPQRGPLPEFFPESPARVFLWDAAPAAPLLPPVVGLVKVETSGDTRTLRLRVASPRHARLLALRLPEAEVLSASLNGKPLAGSAALRSRFEKGWLFACLNPPADGIEIVLQVKGTAPVKMVAIDRSSGLPEIPGIALRRPDTTVPVQSGDQIVVSKSFVF